jgi:FtsH-binding integral membrane protein
MRKEIKEVRLATMFMWVAMTIVWFDSMIHFDSDPRTQGWLILLFTLVDGLTFLSIILPYHTRVPLESTCECTIEDGGSEVGYYKA